MEPRVLPTECGPWWRLPQANLMRATPFPPTSDLLVLSLAQSNRKTEDKGVAVMLTGDRLTKQRKAGSHRPWWP